MPIKKVEIPPGLDRESTQQSSGPQWFDANNIRFRDKFAQTVGGWVDSEYQDLQGIARALHSWTDFEGNQFQIVGTMWKYYLISGTTVTDITPQRYASASFDVDLSSDLNVTDTESVVTVAHVAHGMNVNDWVQFTAVGSAIGTTITPAILKAPQQGWQVLSVPDDDSYTIQTDVVASSTTSNGGGTVTARYQVASGQMGASQGTGFGVSNWGGEDYNPTSYALGGLICTVTGGGSPNVTLIANATYTFVTGGVDWIYVMGLTGTVSGLDLTYLNDKWWQVNTVTGAPDPVIDVGYNIAAAGASGGTSGTFFAYDDTDDAVEGATRGWGTASELSAAVGIGAMRTMSIDNFGEDVIAHNRGGPLYYYDTSLNVSSGVPATTLPLVEINSTQFTGSTSTPTIADSFIISQGHGHVVVFGCNDIGSATQNRMLVRWSDRHNPFTWTPNASGEAGGDVLRSGSNIMMGVATKDEIVIFTDTSVYSMRYVGSPEIYGIQLISAGAAAYSRMSAIAVDNSVYFMGNEQFYVYNGAVQSLPKNLSNFVFDNLNTEQKDKVFAGVNSAFTEVMWFYPDGSSFECNRYISYNYSNGTWSMGAYDMVALSESAGGASGANLNRTAWQDSSVFSDPIAAYVKEYNPDGGTDQNEVQISRLMNQESGTSANGVNIEHHIESGEVDLDDGYHYAFYDKLIPDIQLFDVDSEISDSSITASMQGRDLPGKAQKAVSSVTIDTFLPDPQSPTSYAPDFNATTIRGRARSVSIKLSSSGTGFGWRTGTMRIRVRPDGKD